MSAFLKIEKVAFSFSFMNEHKQKEYHKLVVNDNVESSPYSFTSKEALIFRNEIVLISARIT